MKIILQRVNQASVSIDNEIKSEINKGYLLFVGVEDGDGTQQIDYLTHKISNLRIFEDEVGKMNLNISQVDGDILSISQFTLMADTKKGNRPAFVKAGNPKVAKQVYLDFNQKLRENNLIVKEGIFGADMKVSLENNGPATFILEK